jgi:L-rhamnose mutarotase
MERIAFRMRVRPGHEEEYRRRHQAVWPLMLDALTGAGCSDYSIYMDGSDLFARMDVQSFDRFLETMAASDVNRRWQAYMADILDPCIDPATGFHRRLQEVFHVD